MSTSSVLITITTLLRSMTACKYLSYFEDGIEIPYTPLDVCYNTRFNLTGYTSIMLTCNENHNLKALEWNNTDCTGDYYAETYPPLHDDQYHFGLHCQGDICPYTMLKLHISTSCEDSDVTGYYYEYPLVVDICYAGLVKQVCTESDVTIVSYLEEDCTGDIEDDYTYIENGICDFDEKSQLYYIYEIMNCPMTGDYSPQYDIWKRLATLDGFSALISLIAFICGSCITSQIIFHLYECDCYSPGWCKLVFSDRHNWLIQPSSCNRRYALGATLLYTVLFALSATQFIIRLVLHTQHEYLLIPEKWSFIDSCVSYLFILLCEMSYFMYLVSTLEYFMRAELLIKVVIPRWVIIFIKIVIFLGVFQYCIWVFIWFKWNESPIMNRNIDFELWFAGVSLVRNAFIILTILYLYTLGISNISHFYTAKIWKEFEQYGENERTHENAINIARVTVIIIFVVVFMILADLITFIFWYYYNEDPNNLVFYVVMFMVTCSAAIKYITMSLSIYFIYQFGHRNYLKICSKCQYKMYNYCKQRHQNQVKNGAFDDSINSYQPNNKRKRGYKQTNDNSDDDL